MISCPYEVLIRRYMKISPPARQRSGKYIAIYFTVSHGLLHNKRDYLEIEDQRAVSYNTVFDVVFFNRQFQLWTTFGASLN